MPWTDEPLAGFTRGKPWLPIPEEHRRACVALQAVDPDSPLRGLTKFLRWRAALPVLRRGAIEGIAATENVLSFRRRLGDELLMVAFNLGDTAAVASFDGLGGAQPVSGHGLPEGRLEGERLALPPHGVFFGRISGGVQEHPVPYAT
jgi:alpha-glucosidase